jgi:hypothetical protein
MTDTTERRAVWRKAPPEIVNILGTSGAILAVVAVGSAIVSRLPEPDAWQFAGAYIGPASLAFAVYWWVAQKL